MKYSDIPELSKASVLKIMSGNDDEKKRSKQLSLVDCMEIYLG
jgi:hypothetical protein